MSKGGRKISRFPFRTFSGDFLEVFGANRLTRINFRIKIIALVFVASKAQSNICRAFFRRAVSFRPLC